MEELIKVIKDASQVALWKVLPRYIALKKGSKVYLKGREKQIRGEVRESLKSSKSN